MTRKKRSVLDEKEYEFLEILEWGKNAQGELIYKLHWEDNTITWELKTNIPQASVDAFHAKHPDIACAQVIRFAKPRGKRRSTTQTKKRKGGPPPRCVLLGDLRRGGPAPASLVEHTGSVDREPVHTEHGAMPLGGVTPTQRSVCIG